MPDLAKPSDPPRYHGNPADLEAFDALLASPIRHEQRESALAAWSEYKLRKQALFVRQQPGKQGLWTKGDYIRSLTAPAIDLRGATFIELISVETQPIPAAPPRDTAPRLASHSLTF